LNTQDKIKRIDKLDVVVKNKIVQSKLQENRFGEFPRLDPPNDKGQLTWYPIGFPDDFSKKPTKVTIQDKNYVVWKDQSDYYGMHDVCSHQGSSFMLGTVCKNTITCPYHGYIFDGSNGELVQIPKLPHIVSDSHNIDCFKVVEKGDMVYLNTVTVQNEEMKIQVDEASIFVEPEFYDKSQRVLFLTEDFEHHAKFVTTNSLDICHIGFVHTFGNRNNPNPLHNSKIQKVDDQEYHYKIVYDYTAGENSLVNKVYNFDNINVENEYDTVHPGNASAKHSRLKGPTSVSRNVLLDREKATDASCGRALGR
jgi:phenylpropionate dioxygenase-like ring-hydroxylating dioxygenase large terminal subunit